MIGGQQLADLQPGDVVELFDSNGTTVRGTLRRFGLVGSRGLCLGSSGMVVRRVDGCLAGPWGDWTLTVVSRAPRPLYVNHPRTEPVAGDVVRVETGQEDDWYLDMYLPREGQDPAPWVSLCPDEAGARYPTDEAIPQKPDQGCVRLVIDGETGQVVPQEADRG